MSRLDDCRGSFLEMPHHHCSAFWFDIWRAHPARGLLPKALPGALKGHFQLHLHDCVFVVLHPAGHLLTAGQYQRFGGLDDRRVLEAYILRSVPWKVRLRLSTAWPDQQSELLLIKSFTHVIEKTDSDTTMQKHQDLFITGDACRNSVETAWMFPTPSCIQNSTISACGKIWAHVTSLHCDRLRSEFLFSGFRIVQTAKVCRPGGILGTTGLFVAEGDYRIDAHGFTGRRVACDQSDCSHEKSNERKGGHVARAHAIN